jgi:glycosyltransferase involved in cell wall biosynthesis
MSESKTNRKTIENVTDANQLKPLVSVIIPTYNSASFVPQSVESVLQQTYDNFEVIVVDDGSTDNTEAALLPYKDKIRYIKKTNSGPSAARNLGITEAKGEFIAFQDADDLWLPEKLQLQIEHFKQNPHFGVIFTGSVRFNESGLLDSNIRKGYTVPTGMVFDRLLTEHFVAMPSVMVRKSCLDEVGLFEESLIGNEDFNLYLRLARKYAFGFVNQVLVRIRIHENNLSDNLEQMCEDELKNLEKISLMFPDAQIPKRKLSAGIYARFGRYYFSQQRFDEARRCFYKAFRRSPFLVKTWHLWVLARIPNSLRNGLLTLNRSLKRASFQNSR